MKKKTGIWIFLGGILAGIGIAGVAMAQAMPSLMLKDRVVKGSVAETVGLIRDNAKAMGWVVSGVKPIDRSVKKNGGPEVPATRLVELCQARHAGTILADETSRKVSVFMPCTISVWEGGDGRTHVTSMNAGLMGKMMGGTVAEVMGGAVAKEQKEILTF